MDARVTVLAALLVAELTIVGLAVAAVRGVDVPLSYDVRFQSQTASDGPLIEDGPHRIFRMGPRPALTVNIGYADLTILTSKTAIDASVSASSSHGIMETTAPITARRDGESLVIATSADNQWSTGDNRMVTVLVPAQTEVTVIRAGDIRATGLRAEASFKSVGRGSIAIEDYAGPALRVVSEGSIALHGIVAARLDAESSDSRVEGSALRVRDGSVHSDDGATLGFAPAADTLITAEASDGKITVSGFAPTAASGRASTDDGDEDSSSRTVRAGNGHGNFDVRSNDGNIVLTQDG